MSETIDTANLPHDNLQAQAIALIFTFPVAATVALALRLYSRSLTRTFASDDLVICFALALYWAETFASYEVIIKTYIGYHLWDIPAVYDTVLASKYGYATEILYNPILGLVKTSILLFLLRLTGQKSNVRKTIWALLVFNGIAMILTLLLTIFHCVPVQSNWNAAGYPGAKCMNFADFVTGTASVSILTDAVVLMLPTWIVYNLQIQRKQKIILIGILSFGLITVVVGIVRVVILDDFDRHIPADPNYSLIFCISTIEVGLAFIAACAPAMKPIVVKVLPKVFGQSSRAAGKYSRNGTARSSRLGYQMDHMSRRTQGHPNSTQVNAGGRGKDSSLEADRLPVQGIKKGIAVTTETEVTWQDARRPSKNGSSTESLV